MSKRGTETDALLALRNWVRVPMTTLCWISHLLLAAQATPRISGTGPAILVAASIIAEPVSGEQAPPQQDSQVVVAAPGEPPAGQPPADNAPPVSPSPG